MNVTALQSGHSAPPPALTGRQATGADSFERMLRDAGRADDSLAVEEVASRLVSLAFVEPVLAKLRETSLAAGPFAPSDAERRFGPLFDQHLADRITSSANFPLVDSLRDHLLSRGAGGAGFKEEAHG